MLESYGGVAFTSGESRSNRLRRKDGLVMVERISRMKLKICLVGERAVGKTSLLSRYVFNTFDVVYKGTLGSKMSLLSFKQIVAGNELVEAQVALFDLMGERAIRDSFRDVVFWGAHGFLAVADVTRSHTLQCLPEWVDCVHSVAGEIPFGILINKIDQAPSGNVDPKDAKWLQSTFPDVPYYLTSAKTNEGVEAAFDSLIEGIVASVLAKSMTRRETKLISERLLDFARRRGNCGVTKNDLLKAFKVTDISSLMKEVEDLNRLGLIILEPTGPASFVIRLTDKGEKELESIERTERIVEEPV